MRIPRMMAISGVIFSLRALFFVLILSAIIMVAACSHPVEPPTIVEREAKKPPTVTESSVEGVIHRGELTVTGEPFKFADELLSVYEGADGGLWVLTRQELLRSYDHGQTWMKFGSAPQLPKGAVVKSFSGPVGWLVVYGYDPVAETRGYRFEDGQWIPAFSFLHTKLEAATWPDNNGCFVGARLFPLDQYPVFVCYSLSGYSDYSEELRTTLRQSMDGLRKSGKWTEIEMNTESGLPEGVSETGNCVRIIDTFNQMFEKCGSDTITQIGTFPKRQIGRFSFFSWTESKVRIVESSGGVEGYGAELMILDNTTNVLERIGLEDTHVGPVLDLGPTSIAFTGSWATDSGVKPIIGFTPDDGRNWYIDPQPRKIQIVASRDSRSVWAFSANRLFKVSVPRPID